MNHASVGQNGASSEEWLLVARTTGRQKPALAKLRGHV
jgi:hypothetical protein